MDDKEKQKFDKVQELLNKKWEIENNNVRLFQRISEMKMKRLQNIKSLDMLENDLRKSYGQLKIRRSEIR